MLKPLWRTVTVPTPRDKRYDPQARQALRQRNIDISLEVLFKSSSSFYAFFLYISVLAGRQWFMSPTSSFFFDEINYESALRMRIILERQNLLLFAERRMYG